jgi:predicted NAD/FAD-binding protein
MRIAVVGTGIAGNAAAWTLSKRYPLTVYEREIPPSLQLSSDELVD